ncbi:Caffeic acid-3-O-methyltransferase [Rhynchospora pubera]|uniref:Caffeic acid-3-O-methyltransferase n=1 Tax=Rhynchospora pubera TaxID=906938 RepID=A0AAV8FXJ7_9POAL|nr:Caffeic acid-3-O-methyltransferase [Rhynchospora pubera]KAJ4768779.1 Caffeic acid-3-O-methyltransferase [Rhynchospora pubera]KAJ4797624.1 Caffeic acid-3-O-methyltransferase [Rhynchospora pubera]KAJ4821528.1 Caffeic acid-3-O-methyltransferase [Rhynchospora pubera]
MGSNELDMDVAMPLLSQDEELYVQMSIVGTAIFPLTLKAVMELGVLEIIKMGSASASAQPAMMTAEDIAAQLPTKNPQAAAMLDRMLALLASYNIVSCVIEKKEKVVRRYGPAPFFKLLTKDDDGVTVGTLSLLGMEQAFISAGQHLKESVLEGGIAFEKAHGMEFFEYIGANPSFRNLFNKGMMDNTTFFLKKLLETYQGFKDVHVLVDVGGGVGAALGTIVSKYTHIKGINLDLPHAIAAAPPLPGVEHVGGDMFDCIPHGDTIMLKYVLHNWSNEHCVKILKNCYDAIPNEGKVIILEIILPVNPEPTTRSKGTFIMDLMMLTYFGGKERTKIEFENLAKEAGFTRMEIQYFNGETWIIELRK